MSNAVVAAPALAAFVAAIVVVALRRFARLLPADVPNARSLHAEPVPRAGGYAIWAGFLPAALLFPLPFPGGIAGWMPAWFALFAVSAADDRRGVGIATRLTVQAAASVWTAAWLVHAAPQPGGPAMAALLFAVWTLCLAWSANLFNFMDGNDGLAATMGLCGFAAYGIAAMHAAAVEGVHAAGTSVEAPGAAPALLALAAAIVPFLAVNRPRASMFLGDVGAVPLGFLAAAFGIGGIVSGRWPSWFPLLVFLPFIADATVTLLRRATRGERLWEGHRSHYYQRLHQLGAGHAGTLAAYGVVMLGSGASAVGCLIAAPAAGPWALAGWCVVVVMLFAAIDYHWRKNATVQATR
jgi:UDP-GlcNAc:undecaprenyl-phosphate/decaprenyl-phosphate GlcNAc-1-phosphate transferase